LTKEQEQYATIVADLKEMDELNASTLKYIDIPYRLEYADDAFWTILKKVLVY
jgi:transposase